MDKYYITTAIDYPNAAPHIGHAFEKMMADAFARWHRIRGRDTFFATGLDEHGQKLKTAAEAKGITPQEFVDEMAILYKEFCKTLNISNDDFIRTTEQRHKDVAASLFQKVFDKGEIYLGKYKGNYCVPCESFWTELQLVDGKCPECNRETKILEEDAYFFKMASYQERLIKHIKDNPGFIVPETRKNEILSRLEQPLKDLCVSRSTFNWGIPLPNDDSHIIYVWFDALINYISVLGYPDDENYKEFWPADCHVIGKDIIWFHTVIWPCILMACDIPLPRAVLVHGFVNDENGEKMSKSKGNVVAPLEVIEKTSIDAFRYYLLRSVPTGADCRFSYKDLIDRYNNELGNDLGNLVKRIGTLLVKTTEGKISNSDYEDNIEVVKMIEKADAHMVKFENSRALDTIWSKINDINAYINEKEPWKITNDVELRKVIYNVVENLRIATSLLYPFIPDASIKIAEQFGFKIGQDMEFGKGSFELKHNDVLFPRMELAQEPTFPLNLKVAKILEAKPHPDADKLMILKLDLGLEQRQIVAGIKPYYSVEELIDRQIVVVTNLKPAKLRGEVSNGMLLAASKEENTCVLVDANDCEVGEEVLAEGIKGQSKKIDFKEFMKIKLEVKNHKVLADGKVLDTKSGKVHVDVDDGWTVR